MSLDYWLFNKEKYYVCGNDYGVTSIIESESFNITNNLTTMAIATEVDFVHSGYGGESRNLYQILWHPIDNGFTKVNSVYIETLELLYNELASHPEYYKEYNATNEWGLYKHLVTFVKKILELCKEHQDWYINTST